MSVRITFDGKCYELALIFLSDTSLDAEKYGSRVAMAIQGAIESELEQIEDEEKSKHGERSDGTAMTSPGTKRAIVAMLPELHARGYQVVEGEIGISIVQTDYREHTEAENEAFSQAVEDAACSEE